MYLQWRLLQFWFWKHYLLLLYLQKKQKVHQYKKIKASSKIGAVNLSWSEVKRADGYLVYGIRGGEKYGYIGMTSKTSFSDTKALTSDYNFYWVFPYHTDGNGNKVAGGTAHYVYGRAGL